ncbi:MAG: tRNA epoxyqueuosine(34) reductase QueG [Alphaproteobacteria bacterium]|nr:tRNA epoxyqueuosine(34) reductase QueG [Alphaproteobacteria bacterium]
MATIDRESLRREVMAFGFDAVRFTAARTPDRAQNEFRDFIAADFAGDMTWLTDTADRRADVSVLWPEARSAIMVALNYGPVSDVAPTPADLGDISVYARNRDYHDTLKKRLKAFARWLTATHGGDVKVFVDTAPLLEKPLAQASGLGWQGKHTNLVSRQFGSWLFLAEVLTTLEIAPDPSESDHCGECRQCLDICPTRAFTGPYRIDPRRCISYLTIEHKSHIPRDLREGIGNRIYGCDACLAICPWNKFARTTTEPDFLPRAELTAPRLADLAMLDDGSFRALFGKSPIKRIGRHRFVRNVLIAIGNSQRPSLAGVARTRVEDPSPIVRAAAIWALSRLLDAHDFAALSRQYRAQEVDDAVRAEWAP